GGVLQRVDGPQRQLHAKTVGQQLLDIAFGQAIRPTQYGNECLQARTKSALRHPLGQQGSRDHPTAPAAESVELVLTQCRLQRGQLNDLMAEGRSLAAPEWAPAAGAVGGLADM